MRGHLMRRFQQLHRNLVQLRRDFVEVTQVLYKSAKTSIFEQSRLSHQSESTGCCSEPPRSRRPVNSPLKFVLYLSKEAMPVKTFGTGTTGATNAAVSAVPQLRGQGEEVAVLYLMGLPRAPEGDGENQVANSSISKSQSRPDVHYIGTLAATGTSVRGGETHHQGGGYVGVLVRCRDLACVPPHAPLATKVGGMREF